MAGSVNTCSAPAVSKSVGVVIVSAGMCCTSAIVRAS